MPGNKFGGGRPAGGGGVPHDGGRGNSSHSGGVVRDAGRPNNQQQGERQMGWGGGWGRGPGWRGPGWGPGPWRRPWGGGGGFLGSVIGSTIGTAVGNAITRPDPIIIHDGPIIVGDDPYTAAMKYVTSAPEGAEVHLNLEMFQALVDHKLIVYGTDKIPYCNGRKIVVS